MAKELTVRQMASMGGRARAEKYGKRQIRAWGKQGGRPRRVTGKTLERLRRMLAAGKPHAEISRELGVSLRTVGRVLARLKAHTEV